MKPYEYKLKAILDMVVVVLGTTKSIYNGVLCTKHKRLQFPIRYGYKFTNTIFHHSNRGRD